MPSNIKVVSGNASQWVCVRCGSKRVYLEARVHLNSDEVMPYDQYYCADCASECTVEERKVAD